MPAQKNETSEAATARSRMPFMRVARPDVFDHRDRQFRAGVGLCPAPEMFPARALRVKHQGETLACTGFALSLVVEHLLHASGREARPDISPFMLYSMARRYDEYPGSTEDKGSSLRGALKGWFKHGACRAALFPHVEMPAEASHPGDDWWADAVRRPLGSYYRVDTHSIADMHAALNEVGILVASSACHSGWDDGIEQPIVKRRPTSLKGIWEIPVKGGHAHHEGHAFAIVGYNAQGFLIQNSWGTGWGTHGYAILTYDDWLRNAMDCWVAQLGVVTHEHLAISRAATLRTNATGQVTLAASKVLRNRELAPFIVNVGNDGSLNNSGAFRTQPGDLSALIDVHLAHARERWGIGDGPIDVCLYAHSGLVGEAAAAEIAAQWIPMLYGRKIFPIFLMWETDFFGSTLGCIAKAVKDLPRSFEPPRDSWWNERLERLLARPGTRLWGEMKQNADAISTDRPQASANAQAGGVLLCRHVKRALAQQKIRMHVVGHSAGSIAASFMIDRLATEGMKLESVSFMAPAVTVQAFSQQVLPHLRAGAVKRYQQFHLSDAAERHDKSCGAYRRSLLYLVSQSFEGGSCTPVLGMQTFFDASAKEWPRTTAHVAPGEASAATTHGGFDDDPATRSRIIDFILNRRRA